MDVFCTYFQTKTAPWSHCALGQQILVPNSQRPKICIYRDLLVICDYCRRRLNDKFLIFHFWPWWKMAKFVLCKQAYFVDFLRVFKWTYMFFKSIVELICDVKQPQKPFINTLESIAPAISGSLRIFSDFLENRAFSAENGQNQAKSTRMYRINEW